MASQGSFILSISLAVHVKFFGHLVASVLLLEDPPKWLKPLLQSQPEETDQSSLFDQSSLRLLS